MIELRFSRIENPDTWDTELGDELPFKFASHEDAVKAAEHWNALYELLDEICEVALSENVRCPCGYGNIRGGIHAPYCKWAAIVPTVKDTPSGA